MFVTLTRLVGVASAAVANTVRTAAGVDREPDICDARPTVCKTDDLVNAVWALRYPLHFRAFHRHAEWAREFAAVGDVAAAMEAVLDFDALAGELHIEVALESHRGEAH